jgi:hypothetical protein
MAGNAKRLVARFVGRLVLEYRAVRNLLDETGPEHRRRNTQRHIALGERCRKIGLCKLAVRRIGAAGDRKESLDLAARRAVVLADEPRHAYRSVDVNE